jgi:hypothetical protein
MSSCRTQNPDAIANELLAYNIAVAPESPESFFDGPLPTLDGIGPLLVSGTVDTVWLTQRWSYPHNGQ